MAGLSAFQMLGIGGGKAFETISKVENQRKGAILASLTKTIDDARVPAGEYRQKHMLVQSKANEQIQKIINTHFNNQPNMTQSAKVVAATALYAHHDYDYKNIQKAYTSSLKNSKYLGGSKKFGNQAFLDSQFKNLAKIDGGNATLSDLSTLIAQNKVGPAPTGFDSGLLATKALDQGSSILTSPITIDSIGEKAKAAFNLPNVIKGDLPSVAFKGESTIDLADVAESVQKYKMNDAQMQSWISKAKESKGMWKATDWDRNYKTFRNAAIEKSKLDYKVITGPNGLPTYKMPGGTDNAALREEVERASLRNFVLGAVGSNTYTENNFKSYIQSIAANVTGLKLPTLPNRITGEDDIDNSKLVPGMIYQQGRVRVIFGGYKTKTNISGIEVPDKNNAIMIRISSYQPSKSE
tara:strand:+ start:1686 stop:2915 length:1230 start_codon:yes stop_codon:yes gene_type:complete